MDFVSLLTKGLLSNSLTCRTLLPHPSFNLEVLGAEVQVLGDEQDPEVPAFEKLSQESVFSVAGLHPEMEEVLNSKLPARSVEQGQHALRKVDEWIMETHEETDHTGKVKIRDVRRRKRGRCKFCGSKTSYYCYKCSFTTDSPGRYWCCGPDVCNGREFQMKHDSEWVFGNMLDEV